MTAPDAPDPDAPDPDAPEFDAPADDRRDDPPAPAASRIAERSAPETEAQRETAETVRSISRLEESN